MAASNKVLRPDSLNLTLDQSKHLAPDIGANQAGLLFSLRDLLKTLQLQWDVRQDGASQKFKRGGCWSMHVHIHHIHARTCIYIYYIYIDHYISIYWNTTTTNSQQHRTYFIYIYISISLSIYIYIYITIAQPVSYLFYFIPLRPRIIFTPPNDSSSRLENRGVTGLETDMEWA